MLKGEGEFLDRASRLSRFMEMLGYAVWQAQRLEHALASYVVVRLRDCRGVGLEKGQTIHRKEQQRTLGLLFGEVAQSGLLSDQLISELKFIKNERNWMVHHLSREEHGVLDIPEKYCRVLRRLEQIADDSLSLSKRLGEEIENYAIKSGVSPKFIEDEAARLIRSRGLEHLI
ncbi:MAG: hypothetical protein KJ927_04145 [Candidatus Eisenbacteria bacterium]|nr:hypothetical protein [Candidatus Eisenbacteria bacterium]MBU1947880.1 hypothetical protein [Candidatus Eisenbacteria bacterium]